MCSVAPFPGMLSPRHPGALAVDVCLLLTLYGVCTTYLITATQLLGDTPLLIRYGSPLFLHWLILFIFRSLYYDEMEPTRKASSLLHLSSHDLDTHLT